MKSRIINKFGDVEIDPHNRKSQHDIWLSKIGADTSDIDYFTFKGVSKGAS